MSLHVLVLAAGASSRLGQPKQAVKLGGRPVLHGVVNPQLEPIGDTMEDGWEGCLSVPGMRGLVPRHQQLRYRGFDQYGKPIDRTVTGFHARVVQHEVDHLHSCLFVDRLRGISRDLILRKIKKLSKAGKW